MQLTCSMTPLISFNFTVQDAASSRKGFTCFELNIEVSDILPSSKTCIMQFILPFSKITLPLPLYLSNLKT